MPKLPVTFLLALTVAGCGAPSQGADEPDPSSEATTEEEGQSFVLGVLTGGVRDERAAPAPPPAGPDPADRTDAERAPTTDPALAEAERAHVAALAFPIGTEVPAPDIQAAVAALSAQIAAASGAARASFDLYRPLFEDPRLGPIARTRGADVLDAFAARVARASFPLPLALRRQIAEADAEVRAEVEAAVRDRVRETVAAQARPVFCSAVEHYRAAATPRALDQLSRYGSVFVEHCDASSSPATP